MFPDRAEDQLEVAAIGGGVVLGLIAGYVLAPDLIAWTGAGYTRLAAKLKERRERKRNLAAETQKAADAQQQLEEAILAAREDLGLSPGKQAESVGIQKLAKNTKPVTKRERILNERQGRRDGYINGAAEGLSSTDTTPSGVDHG